MRHSFSNRIHGNRVLFAPATALMLMSSMLLIPGCPSAVAPGGAIGIAISVLAPTVNRDLSPGEKVTVVYNASGAINTLEAIYDLDGTENTGDETVVVGGLAQGDNQFFDLDTTGLPAGTYFIGVRGTNDAGSSTSYASATVRVNGSPNAAFVNPDGSGAPVLSIVVGVGDTVQVSFNMNDPENNVSWRVFYDLDQTEGNRTEVTIATGTGNAGNVEWDTRGVAPGMYFIGVTGTDNVGNTDTGYSPGTVTITRGAFITVTAPAEDVLAFGGEDIEVRFSARGANGGGTIRVFYDEDGEFDGDEVTIVDNLPVSTTSATWDTDTAPNGNFFVGAVVTDILDNSVARYAAGMVQIRKEAGIEITKPADETLVSMQKDDFLIEFFSTVPVGLGTIDIFFQVADASGAPTGDEMPVVDNGNDAATDLPANTRSAEWDLTQLESGGDYVIGARLKMEAGDLEDFSPVVTVSEVPTIELIEPSSNASPPVIVRDPLGNLTVSFEYTDPEDPKEVIIALDPDRPSANIDPTDDILDGDEIVFGPFTDLVAANPDAPVTLTFDDISLEDVPSGTYYIFLRIEDEAGGVDQGYGASQRGEFIALEIRTGRLLGTFWVGQLEIPVNEVMLAGAIFQGRNIQDQLGSAFLSAGDMTFDGLDDFLITARYGKPNNVQSQGVGRGEASLVFGSEIYVNPQPFTGTNFTFDINATGTSRLPGSTLTGVRPTGGLTETNGMGQVVAMKDADGDGRRELAIGFISVDSASEANSKNCSLLHANKRGNNQPEYKRAFLSNCGEMVAPGQLLRGGIVMASSTNGLAQSGRVVNLGDVGIAGFSGNVEYVTEDRMWRPDPLTIPLLPLLCTPLPEKLGVTLTVNRLTGAGGNSNRRIMINGQFRHDIILVQPSNQEAIKSFDDNPDVGPTNIIGPGENNIVLNHAICDDPFNIQGDTTIFITSIWVDDGNGGPLELVPGLEATILGARCESKYVISVIDNGGFNVTLTAVSNPVPGCGLCKNKFALDECCILNGTTNGLFPGQGPDDPSECSESVVAAAFSSNDVAALCGDDSNQDCLEALVGVALSTGRNGFGFNGTGGGLAEEVPYDDYFSPNGPTVNFSNSEWCAKVGCPGIVVPGGFDDNPQGDLLPTGFFSGSASVPGARLVGQNVANGRFSLNMDVFGSDLFATAPGAAISSRGVPRGVAYIWEAASADTLPLQIIDAVADEFVEITTATPHGIGSACVDIEGIIGMTVLNGQSFNAVSTGPTTLRLLVSGEELPDYVSGGTLLVNESLWCDAQLAKPFQYGLGVGTLERGASVPPRVSPLVIVGSEQRYNNNSGSTPGLKEIAPIEQVVGIADFNNDLRTDVAVGVPQWSEGNGAVYIYYRRSKSLEGNVDLTEMELPRTDPNRQTGMMVRPENLVPQNIHPQFGFSLARTGDLNGDGFQDMAIGAPGADQDRGEVVILFGGANLNSPGVERVQGQGIVAADPDAQDGLPGFTITQLMDLGLAVRIVGVSPGDMAGFNVTSAGDVDGDGNPDLLIAAPNATPMFRSTAGGPLDSLGIDNDGDGTADMIVNRFGQTVSSSTLVGAGLVYLVYGSNNLTGTVDLADIGQPNLQGAVFVGAVAGEQLGGGFDEVDPPVPGAKDERFRPKSYGISGAGDVNGDGNDDLLIGAMLADPEGKNNAGEAYLIFGKGGLE